MFVNSMSSLVGALLHCTDEGQQPETSIWMSAVSQDGGEEEKVIVEIVRE